MREAFGGAFMIRLVLVFLVLYISFMAVAVNYAKVFRIKNHIINMLEQYQYNHDDSADSEVLDKINLYLKSVAYPIPKDRDKDNSCSNGEWLPNGACIIPVCEADSCHYKVTVYITVDLPVYFTLNRDFIHSLPISGETRTIVHYQRGERL